MSPPPIGSAGCAMDVARETRPSSSSSPGLLGELQERLATHPFWNNRLLQACRRGVLTREDHAVVFSQYSLLACSMARFLHALLAQCDNEAWGARLTEALWEEEGAPPPGNRPAALFQRFLREGLGVDTASLSFRDCTRYFMRECLDRCLRGPSPAAGAFLAFGLAAPAPRLCSVFVRGLLQAEIPERHLAFFQRRTQADTALAALPAEWVRTHANEPGRFDTCLRAMERALELHGNFLDGLFECVQHRRLGPLLERIHARLPLAPEQPDPSTVHLGDLSNLLPFFHQAHGLLGIDFTVDRVPFPAEVLETHLVRVAAGHRSEPREHAHEVLLVVLGGVGRVHVRGTVVAVKPGDAVFIPRWASHQAHCTGSEPLSLLTVTDHGLTRRTQEEEVLRAARLKHATGVDL